MFYLHFDAFIKLNRVIWCGVTHNKQHRWEGEFIFLPITNHPLLTTAFCLLFIPVSFNKKLIPIAMAIPTIQNIPAC